MCLSKIHLPFSVHSDIWSFPMLHFCLFIHLFMLVYSGIWLLLFAYTLLYRWSSGVSSIHITASDESLECSPTPYHSCPYGLQSSTAQSPH